MFGKAQIRIQIGGISESGPIPYQYTIYLDPQHCINVTLNTSHLAGDRAGW